jgi:hypothetical protein
VKAERFGVPHFLATTMSPHEKYQTSVPEWDRQFRLVRVHHEYREELGRLRLAGIALTPWRSRFSASIFDIPLTRGKVYRPPLDSR